MRVLHVLTQGDIGGIERLCVDIAKYSRHDNYFCFFWRGGKSAEQIGLINNNVIIKKFKYNRVISQFIDFWRYCNVNRIEIIVIQSEAPIILIFSVLVKIMNKKKIRCVSYLHADARALFPKKVNVFVYKKCIKHFNGIIAISKYVKKTLEFLRIKNDSVKILYNGIDTMRLSNSSNKRSSISKRLTFVGRLVKQKGLDILLNSLLHIDNPFELTIVGDGPEKSNLQKMVRNLKLEKKVKFVGPLNNVEDVLIETDLFVHPARCEEGLGIAILEAMSCGVPCVAFEKGGIPEIIKDGVNGFLVKNVDPISLKGKIIEAITIMDKNPDKWQKICHSARKTAEQFDVHKYVNNLDNYLYYNYIK